jgi:hypothetical protein
MQQRPCSTNSNLIRTGLGTLLLLARAPHLAGVVNTSLEGKVGVSDYRGSFGQPCKTKYKKRFRWDSYFVRSFAESGVVNTSLEGILRRHPPTIHVVHVSGIPSTREFCSVYTEKTQFCFGAMGRSLQRLARFRLTILLYI